MPTKTYVDANVLIAAFRGEEDIAERAFEILDDQEREFAASRFLKLELIPMSVHQERQTQLEFYNSYFDAVRAWPENEESVIGRALEIAKKYGLKAVDALHVASADELDAEFVTLESRTKPVCSVSEVTVISLRPSET